MLLISDRTLYLGVGLVFAFNVFILALGPISLDRGGLLEWAKLTAFLVAALIICHKLRAIYKRPSRMLLILSEIFEGLVFLQLAWINFRLLNHLSMSTALPFSDDMLAAWDAALGVNWLAYFEWVHASPFLILLLDLSYTSLTFLSVLALTGLILMRQTLRARYFIETFFYTALICIIVGLFFPVEAAVATLIPDLSLYTNFTNAPGVYHLDHLYALRNVEAGLVLHPNYLPGLVTFPSFHTAAGILLAVAYWRTYMFLPVLTYTLIMIASTPVFGGHYFVDLFAGTALALLVAVLNARRERYRCLFLLYRTGKSLPETASCVA